MRLIRVKVLSMSSRLSPQIVWVGFIFLPPFISAFFFCFLSLIIQIASVSRWWHFSSPVWSCFYTTWPILFVVISGRCLIIVVGRDVCLDLCEFKFSTTDSALNASLVGAYSNDLNYFVSHLALLVGAEKAVRKSRRIGLLVWCFGRGRSCILSALWLGYLFALRSINCALLDCIHRRSPLLLCLKLS